MLHKHLLVFLLVTSSEQREKVELNRVSYAKALLIKGGAVRGLAEAVTLGSESDTQIPRLSPGLLNRICVLTKSPGDSAPDNSDRLSSKSHRFAKRLLPRAKWDPRRAPWGPFCSCTCSRSAEQGWWEASLAGLRNHPGLSRAEV